MKLNIILIITVFCLMILTASNIYLLISVPNTKLEELQIEGGKVSVISQLDADDLTPPSATELCGLDAVVCPNEQEFTVTAFNTVPEQTDSESCISASGDNICGRNDVVACSRKYKLGQKFVIEGKVYECLDRLAQKFDSRLDLSFDKDIKSAKEWGVKRLSVIVLND